MRPQNQHFAPQPKVDRQQERPALTQHPLSMPSPEQFTRPPPVPPKVAMPQATQAASHTLAPTSVRPSNRVNGVQHNNGLEATAASHGMAPAAVPPVHFTNLQKMDQHYAGEETGAVWKTKVKYLDEHQRQAYKVQIQNGKIYDAQGKPFDTQKANTAFAVNKGRAIFIMDHKGNMYVSNEQTAGKFHHSSFLSGAPVAAAGDIRIENGEIKTISRKSGHYKPSEQQLGQFQYRLSQFGINPATNQKQGYNVDHDLS
jgi:hypothetical protein